MNSRDKHTAEQPDDERDDAPVSEATKTEVLRRLDAYARDGKPGRPWHDILAEQRRKLAGPR